MLAAAGAALGPEHTAAAGGRLAAGEIVSFALAAVADAPATG